MNIVSLLSERRVLPDLGAGTRDEVLEEMIEHLVATGGLSEPSQDASDVPEIRPQSEVWDDDQWQEQPLRRRTHQDTDPWV